MAADFTTVVTVARAGSRVVRYLIKPARKAAGGTLDHLGRDPWVLRPARPDLSEKLYRSGHLARRGLGLGVLVLLALLGTGLLFPLVLVLSIGAADGSAVAGGLLGFSLLLGLIGTLWIGRRAMTLLRATPEPLPGVTQGDESALLEVLRTHERALPQQVRVPFHATVLATRDALRASAGETTLSRDAFDARQVAREELPELLATYQNVTPHPQNDAEFTRQLALIQRRMQDVARNRMPERQRALKASGAYLEKKYRPQEKHEEQEDERLG